MRYFLLGIGTLLAVLFILRLRQGESLGELVDHLNGETYPLAPLYVVGFVWSSGKLFALRDKRAAELRMQASLLYEEQYAEYYANVTWAQALTLTHLLLTLTFMAAGILFGSWGFLLGAGIFLSVLTALYCLESMKSALEKRTAACEAQLPEVVSSMAILVNSGMVLRAAWSMIANSGTGALCELMHKADVNMQNGYSDADAIFLFGRSSNSTEVKKFTSALLQNMEKGGGELGGFLAQQSSELWNSKKQKMLQAGERAATKLLLPIVMIFIGIILIVMTAAFAGSLF